MSKKIKKFATWFLCFFIFVGIAMNISPNGPLAIIVALIVILAPFVTMLTKKDRFDAQKKTFAKEIAQEAKKTPEFSKRNDSAIVFDMSLNMQVKGIKLKDKELYNEEKNLWKYVHSVDSNTYFIKKLENKYKLNTNYGYKQEENLEKFKKIVKFCAKEMGADYIGFIHYSYAPGAAGTSNTYNISTNDGIINQRVTVSTGGSSYFDALGIVCHKDYYEKYKSHIFKTNDSNRYYTKRNNYFRKEKEREKVW